MPQKPLSSNLLIAFSALAILSLAVYVKFSAFAPKALVEVPEVKSAQSQMLDTNLPYPKGSTKIGSSNSSSTQQITLETPQSQDEVQSFYKNILLEEGWKVTTEWYAGIFHTVEYAKDNKAIAISTSTQQSNQPEANNQTIVGIEITL